MSFEKNEYTNNRILKFVYSQALVIRTMDFDKIISDLKNKVYHPVYFLMGEEPYFIDSISDMIEKSVLDDSEKEFNQSILYGGETNIQLVISEAKSYPMMSNYRVVIVKEAQNLKDIVPKEKPETKSKEKEEKKHPLEAYLDNPQKSTILVFCHKYKTIDMRTGFAKSLGKKAVVMKSESLYDNQVPAWIEKYLKGTGYSIDERAAYLLTEFLGNDLSKISNELGKLFLNIPSGTTITTDHIQQFIGISKEYNNFELQSAVGNKDVLKANRIINYFSSNPKDHPMVVTVATLAGYFTKLLVYHSLQDKSQNNAASALKVPPFFVKDYSAAARNYSFMKTTNVISLLREYDLKSKGYESSGSGEAELMKEMVFRIMH